MKVLVMIDIATGLSMLAPSAWIIRNAMRLRRPGAALHSADATVNTTMPVWNVRLRPTRSASEPASISRLARTIV
jgi:hypothetical protein